MKKERCPVCSHELQEENYCDYCAMSLDDIEMSSDITAVYELEIK